MQEEKIKEIISKYTKIPADQIVSHTVIDRTAVASSVLLHRMYADLAKEGLQVNSYLDIKNYGMLLQRLNPGETLHYEEQKPVLPETDLSERDFSGDGQGSIGIDIEQVANMPSVPDFREDKFYSLNFAPSEIAWCILQNNPLISFAGLFAAKEAIVKANNQFKKQPFNKIIIDHLPGGKPIHSGFYLSISHTADLAIAVAAEKNTHTIYPSSAGIAPAKSSSNTSFLYLICITAIILSIIAILITLFKR